MNHQAAKYYPPRPVETHSTRKWATSCCALCQITANDDTPIEELDYQIGRLQDESTLNWTPNSRISGERAAFCITTPNEPNLKANLVELGFENTFTFARRNGYPDGELEMWMKKW